MSPPPDWTRQAAHEIAAQVRQGLAKSTTIATALLERIKERDSIHHLARRRAPQSDGRSGSRTRT
jgi:hypothetical protein